VFALETIIKTFGFMTLNFLVNKYFV